ncbi:MAG: ribonuclease HII [Bacteroidota bacterium]|nr:ribonuclease HII [Bacteroidota bacterium]
MNTTNPLAYERIFWSHGITHIAGVDEAGRGPLAGPVVAAAVIFPREATIPGVNDSKQLTEKRREILFDEIYRYAIAVGVGIVDHEVIDRINILQASLLAMHKAVDALSVQPERLLVDGNFFSHENIPVENIIKGDTLSHSIAAASIVAKVTRDRMMRDFDREFPNYGFGKHKGYGTRAHVEAIRQYGLCAIHRRTFHIASSSHGTKALSADTFRK